MRQVTQAEPRAESRGDESRGSCVVCLAGHLQARRDLYTCGARMEFAVRRTCLLTGDAHWTPGFVGLTSVCANRPGMLDLSGKAKWDAWKGLEGERDERRQRTTPWLYCRCARSSSVVLVSMRGAISCGSWYRMEA